MKKLLFLICLCLTLAGCAAEAGTEDKKEGTKESLAETAALKETEETEDGRSDGEEMTVGETVEYLENFEPELEFENMDASETAQIGGILADSYELIGRRTEEGFGYVLAFQRDEESVLSGLTVYGTNDDIAAGKWNEDDGDYERVYLFTEISSLLQGDGNRILYLQPEKMAVPEELQEVFYYRYCDGKEGVRHLNDAIQRGVRFTPPENGAYLSVERYDGGQSYTEYVALTPKEEQAIIESEEVVDPLVYGNYGIQFFVSEDTYENEEVQEGRITVPALEIAEERCRFQVVELAEIHDIVKAEMKMEIRKFDENTGTVSREWEETETVTDEEALESLEEILTSSEPVYEGEGPYTGILTLTREDGRELVLHMASEDCGSFILGSHAVYSPGEEKMERLWELFPMIRENTGLADSR